MKDLTTLLTLLAGILIVVGFAAVVALAADKDPCVAKAEKILEACHADLGSVHICNFAYRNTLKTCQINKGE